MTDLALRLRRAKSSWGLATSVRKNNSLRPDIQGLRAFAVLAVILDHLVHWPRGGFLGVDMFFVISGFVITASLLREQERTGRISFAEFYRRRIKRILPASTLVLIVTVAASYVAFNQSRFNSVVLDSIWALFFSGNWHFAAVGIDYFQASGPVSPLQHYWSLGVEEQFYFVWPWIMLAIIVFMSRRGNAGTSLRITLGLAIGIICIASFSWAVHESTSSPTIAYFSTVSRAWELGIGALLAVLAPMMTHLRWWIRPVMAWLGVFGMVFSLFIIEGSEQFPAPQAALPVMSTALFIAAGTGSGRHMLLAPFTNPISGYLGNISYSLYLWHFPIIVITAAFIDESPAFYAVAGLGGLLAAVYSYHLVEDPIRKSGWLSERKPKRNSPPISSSYKLTALSLLALITVPVVAAAWVPPVPPQAAVSLPALPAATTSGGASSKQSELQTQIVASLAANSWPSLSPSFEEVIGGRQAPEDIGVCGRPEVVETNCTWGDPNATRTIVTVGSSTSMAYVAALRAAIGTADGWRLISYGMFGCPVSDSEGLAKLKVLPDGCLERASQALTAIDRIQPDVVIASGVYESAGTVLRKTAERAKIVFLPGPPIDKNIAECYDKLSTPMDCVSQVPKTWAATEKSLAQSLENAVYVDTTPWFCTQGLCPSFVGTTPMKLDATHITAAYAEKLGPVVRETFQKEGILDFQG